jgi:hypothetical protein
MKENIDVRADAAALGYSDIVGVQALFNATTTDTNFLLLGVESNWT